MRLIMSKTENRNRIIKSIIFFMAIAAFVFLMWKVCVSSAITPMEQVTKNALDFQLATQLGFLIANKSAEQYFIVSKDKGFEILSGYWKSRNLNVSLIAVITGRCHTQEVEET